MYMYCCKNLNYILLAPYFSTLTLTKNVFPIYYIYMFTYDRLRSAFRLKLAFTDVIISNHGPI